MNQRIEKLQGYMAANGLQGFLVGSPANRRYLSGFTGSNGMLLITIGEVYIVTDFRYIQQVGTQCPEWKCIDQGALGLVPTILKLIQENRWERIAFEAEHISFGTYQTLASQGEWVPTYGVVEGLRQIKESEELEKLAHAEQIGDQAFKAIIPFIEANWKQGLTENQVVVELERLLRVHGASGTSFGTIVASGEKSALPHATPGEVTLKHGDFVVMDFGCVYEGYCSDMTRTFIMGEASKEQIAIYETVLRAQETALKGIKPGMKGKEVDALARTVIEEAHYGQYFGHGLGHAVGLEVHENPRFSKAEEQVIRPGMVLTVEPGIYIPGVGGVRIEDLVVVTEVGIKNLTHSPKQLTIIA